MKVLDKNRASHDGELSGNFSGRYIIARRNY